jgi:hypothetical protein
MTGFRTILILTLALLCAGSARGATTVRASLDRATIMAGESVTLQVIVEGSRPTSAENFPAVPGLTIQHRGNSQQMTVVNSVSTMRFTLSFAVTAHESGQYQIPSIRVLVDGAQQATQPLTLTVTKNDLPAESREAFARLIAPKTNVYIGEIIPIEVQLYVTSGNNLQAPQLQSDGFVIHKQAPHTTGQTQIGQTIYNIVSFKMSVSAAKAGRLALGPAEISFNLLVRPARDPNDPFGFFNRPQARPTKAATPVVEMNVLPLPGNRPPNFSGAIGTFAWSVEASPKSINVGDPITLRVSVTGAGNLDNLKLPGFNWPDFKFYPANSSFESADPLGLEGTKAFEQVVIPQSASVRELPPLTVAFFNPERKAYENLAHPAIPIEVRASSAAPAVPTVARTESAADEEPAERTDIVHIKMETGPMIATTTPLIQRPWFLLAQAIPLLAYAGFTVWRKRQDEWANNPRLRRKVQVRQATQAGLAELRQLATANNGDEFHALVFRLLQEQLGERLDLPASAITEAAVDDRLPSRGASPDLAERLHALFRVCNQARYAPIQTNAELLAVAKDLEKAIVELQQLPD